MESYHDEVDLADQPIENDDEALASFSVPMFVGGDDDNIFHAKNASMTDWNRRIVKEHFTKATEMQCFLLDVQHGTLDNSLEPTPATIIVFKFRFAAIKHRRRLVRARINIEFFSKDPHVAAPTVLAIGMDDRWTVQPTVDHEDSVAGGKASFGVSGVPFVQAAVEASLERTRGMDIEDAITITGGTRFGKGIDCGDHTACSWTLLENQTRKTGIPHTFTIPVLLQRTGNEQFSAVVDVRAEGNILTNLDWIFNKVPIDDPVLFNPAVDRLSLGKKKGSEKVKKEKEGERNEQENKLIIKEISKSSLGEWELRMDELSEVKLWTLY